METTTAETTITNKLISIKSEWLNKTTCEKDFSNFVRDIVSCVISEQEKQHKNKTFSERQYYLTAYDGISLIDACIVIFLREISGDTMSNPYKISGISRDELTKKYENNIVNSGSPEMLIANITMAYLPSFQNAVKFSSKPKA